MPNNNKDDKNDKKKENDNNFSKKLANVVSILRPKTNRLVTDAAPLDDNSSGSSGTQSNTVSVASLPSLPSLPSLEPGPSNPNMEVARRFDSSMEHGAGALVPIQPLQQNVYQFHDVRGVHVGPSYTYTLNNVGAESPAEPRQNCGKKTKSIDAMMKSDEPINQRIMDVVSTHLGEHWRFLFRYLDFTDGQIDQMKEDHHINGTREIIYRLLLDYSRNNEMASLGHLTRAMWKNGFKDCIDILKKCWKNGELGETEPNNE